MVLAILIGPFIWTTPINHIDFGSTLEGPTWNHPFGTDDLGQDLLARLLSVNARRLVRWHSEQEVIA